MEARKKSWTLRGLAIVWLAAVRLRVADCIAVTLVVRMFPSLLDMKVKAKAKR